jgi:hypothetical protein
MLDNMPAVPTGKKPDDVPGNSKKPKARPPNQLREKIIRNPLPYYSGPYSVGMIDIEVPVREPRHFSDIKRDHEYLLELDTVLMSVWYPSGRFVFSQLLFIGEKDGSNTLLTFCQGKWSRTFTRGTEEMGPAYMAS